MLKTLRGTVLGAAVCAVVALAAAAKDDKAEKHQIKGGIEGKVRSVDASKDTLTVETDDGRTRTFTITDDTTMLGPRGGKVRHRLKDPRFRDGFPVIIVASGTTATEVHLGFAKDAAGTHDGTKTARTGEAVQPRRVTRPTETEPAKTEPNPEPTIRSRVAGKIRPAAPTEDEDEDNEIPGRIKRVDPSRRMLIITLMNGKDRSFLISKDTPILVRGSASRRGLEDPAVKAGAHIEVITDEGGRKVKEIKLVPASDRKKAG
jgi:hypothetical protein